MSLHEYNTRTKKAEFEEALSNLEQMWCVARFGSICTI